MHHTEQLSNLEDRVWDMTFGIDLLYLLWVGLESVGDALELENTKTAHALQVAWEWLEGTRDKMLACIDQMKCQ